MDDMDVVSPLVALLIIAVVLVFSKVGKPTNSNGRRRLPPSPPGLPLLGHLPLLGPLPHRKLQAMAARHGPVMLLRFGRQPTVVVSSAAAAQEALKTRDVAFSSRPRVRMAERLLYGRDMAFAPYGDYWRQARRVCVLHLLSQRRVLSFRRGRELEAAALVDRVRRAGPGAAVNLGALLIAYTNATISRAAFGDDAGAHGLHDGDKLRHLFQDFEELLGTVTLGEFVPWLAWLDTLTGLEARATRTFQELDGVLERVIADHRQRRRDGRHRQDNKDDHGRDFVDVMLDVNEAEEEAGGIRFDTEAIKAIILDMFAAATDTTYTTMVWTMAELMNHPDEMRRVQDEVRAAVRGGHVTEDHLDGLRYLKAVIKETFRVRTPLPLLLPRETTEDTELLGYHVPARTRVVFNAWAIARDPAVWERAGEFLPERFAADDTAAAEQYLQGQDFALLPFGAGRRGCPAMGFAMPSMELALASLLYHFNWELPAGGPSKLDMDELSGLSVRLKHALLVVAKPWSQ